MATPRQILHGAATAAALAFGAAAQQPAAGEQNPPPGQGQPPQGQNPPAQQPQQPPVDPTNAAAEILRARLGLKPGPVGEPPKGPVAKPPEPPAPPAEGAGAAVAPGAESAAAAAVPQEPSPQDPKPQPPVDPTEAAKRALQKLLPNAKTPEAAPIPTATGTPEPVADPSQPTAPVETLPTPRPVPQDGLHWSGVASARYRFRHGGGVSDQDLVARLGLDFGDERKDPYTFHFSGRAFGDLDGRRPDDPFRGLDQSYGDEFYARLYLAHVDAHRLDGLSLLRLGRQDLVETPTPVTVDGVRADSERLGAARLQFSAYAGVPVHHFEASASGDSVFGLGVTAQAWHGGRVRLDWMSIRDEFLALDRHDEIYGVRWWQELEGVRLNGLHTWRDGKPRDLWLGLRGAGDLPLDFALDYRELLTTQRAAVTEIDPYYEIAAEYVPFRQVDVRLGPDLGERFEVDVGTALRRLADDADAGTFNREFDRSFVELAVHDVATPGLSFALVGSIWSSDGEDIRTVTGDVSYRPTRDVELSTGTGYDLFKYDVFADFERVHVRTWFLHGNWQLQPRLRLDIGYDYERDDLDEFHQLRVGMTWKL